MFEFGTKTYIMGILNITPDSFSGDGVWGDEGLETAVSQAKQFVADGADILDIGGQSTRPGSEMVSIEEEARRVLPIIRAVREAVEVPISIDTYWSDVAEQALEAGANWINDVWGAQMDQRIVQVAANFQSPIVLMHNRSKPKSVIQEERLGNAYVGANYDDLIEDIKRELQTSIDIALGAGVKECHIILDPGVGFGKTREHNIQIVNELNKLKSLGFPILLGTSRKSFIGYTLNLPPNERMEGTAATVAIGIDRGADIVRVHDVKPIVRLARMTDAIVR
ncbi:MAG: dihydropteroate synthase [Chloroflexota bacterium]